MLTRVATPDDAEDIARLVNQAYEVERFFVDGDRVTPDQIRRELARGTILLASGQGRAFLGCVYVAVEGRLGYFGLLAVAPAAQGRGIGRALIAAAEAHALAGGATTMRITVVNLRTELLEYYGRLGYVPTGSEPYVDRRVTQPVHFVTMEKPLHRPNIDVPL
jgi:GNAT superfamily N-acetyltransferase